MDATPLVTVIVAIYNIEPYIRRCVDSVLAQDYKELEIILVDDGSTDACPGICDEYAMADSRVKVIHKKNGGLSDARNAGLDIAQGDYIGFVDGDDWIDPKMYGSMVKACMEHDARIAVCRYSQYMETEPFTKYELVEWDEGVPTNKVTCLSKKEAFENFISAYGTYQIHNSVWSKLYAKEVCSDLRFPVGKNSEDIMYTTRTFSEAERIVFVDQDLYHYVCGRVGSIMNVGRFERRLEHELPFWKEQENFLRDAGEEELANQSLFYACRRILSYYLDAYDYEKTGTHEKAHYAKKLADVILADKDRLKKIAGASWVRRGDRVRLKLFLLWPCMYAWICRAYERVILPMRNR